MKAIEIYMSVDIEALPDEVWPYLVDWEHLTEWMEEGQHFEVISEQRTGVGVEARATIKMGGIKTTDIIRVTQWEPPLLLGLEHLGWVTGSGIMRCFPTKNGTHLYWREELVPPWGILGAMGIRFFKPLMRRTFQGDLQLLKSLVESNRG